jgi:dCTP deaminase
LSTARLTPASFRRIAALERTVNISYHATSWWCARKPTYARCGIIVNVTPLEPEWEGQVTIEISNTTPLPAKIHAHEGICQFLFLQGNEPCETSYADKAGKYMRQRGVALPRM